jgi:multiple sugar transport system permease protein
VAERAKSFKAGEMARPYTRLLTPPRVFAPTGPREAYWVAFWLLLPASLGLIAFTFAPMVYALWISLHDYQLLSGQLTWVGGGNYARLLVDPLVVQSLLVSGLYAVMSVVAQVVVGLALAQLIKDHVRGLGFFRTAYFLPVVASFVVMATVWKFLYAESGLFNAILLTLGLPAQPFLKSADEALASLAVLGVWKFVGFNMLIFLGGLQAIPADLYEAAALDGAGAVQGFWHITLPLLKRVMLFVVVMTSIESFKLFTPVYVMTSGGPQDSTNAIVFQIFRTGFRYYELGYAAAMSFLLLAVVLVLMWLQFRTLRTDVEY